MKENVRMLEKCNLNRIPNDCVCIPLSEAKVSGNND